MLNTDNIILINPFVRGKIIKGKRIFYENNDGLTKDSEKIIEDCEFIRIYIKDYEKAINELSVISTGILHKIQFKLDYNQDYIHLGYKNVKEWTGISESTYTKFLKEAREQNILMDKDIKKGIFWINPLFFFKGDRLRKYKNQVRESLWITKTGL